MRENKMEVKGYKVFNPDWTCSPRGNKKQYSCPGVFKEEVELIPRERGMHFCKKASDCFNYHSFNSANHVAEVIARGTVKEDGDKCCTDHLEIVREIPWVELLTMVNVGKDCTGLCNTGHHNTGDWNTGRHNSGDWNTGRHNSGDCNTGDRNSGDCNTGHHNSGSRNSGDCNTGDRNSGDCNTGHHNTGDWNTGRHNSGDWNTGRYNSGDCNTGHHNSGSRNSGDCNTGDWNKSSFNTGCFNTEEEKIRLFNKPSHWTHHDWLRSEARYLLNQIPKNVLVWVYSKNMTDEEKAEYPSHETTGGYLKVLDESDCAALWWGTLDDEDKQTIMSIPNFDKAVFKEITGIDVEEE